jgi:integrase
VIKRKPIPDEVFLTHAQVEALAVASRYPGLLRFLSYTGLRWGEATELRVRSIDTERRRAHVQEAVADVHYKQVLGGVKSHERRIVAYPDFMDADVAAACAGKSSEDRLWNAHQGWFAGAVKRCEKADSTFRRVTPHDLRHTAASLAISAGANVKVVQRMLGHKSAKATLDTYAALFPDDVDNVTNAQSRQRTIEMKAALGSIG